MKRGGIPPCRDGVDKRDGVSDWGSSRHTESIISRFLKFSAYIALYYLYKTTTMPPKGSKKAQKGKAREEVQDTEGHEETSVCNNNL